MRSAGTDLVMTPGLIILFVRTCICTQCRLVQIFIRAWAIVSKHVFSKLYFFEFGVDIDYHMHHLLWHEGKVVQRH